MLIKDKVANGATLKGAHELAEYEISVRRNTVGYGDFINVIPPDKGT